MFLSQFFCIVSSSHLLCHELGLAPVVLCDEKKLLLIEISGEAKCSAQRRSLFFSAQVRLQTQPKAKPGESLMYAGTLDCFKKTLAKEVRPPSPRRFPSIPCLTCLCLVPSRGSKGSTKEWRLQSLESRPCLPFVSLDSVWGGSSSRGAPTTSSRGCFCHPAALCSRTAPQLSALVLRRYPQLFAAGMLSGVFTTAIMAPGERIKCLLQVGAPERDSSLS